MWLVIGIGLACIPAFIASRKGRSFPLWLLFGFCCFLPALIASLVIQDRLPSAGEYQQYSAWQRPAQPLPPAGWYPDPGGSGSQRYWDGTRWTEQLH